MKLAAAYQLGATFQTFCFAFTLGIGFMLTSWEEYIVHKFYLPPVNGPDEGLFTMIFLHLAVAIWPGIVEYTQRPLFGYLWLGLWSLTCLKIFYTVLSRAYSRPDQWNRAWKSFIIIVIAISLPLGIVAKSPSVVTNVWFIMGSALTLQYLSQLIIVGFLVKRSPTKLVSLSLAFLWALQLIIIFIPDLPGWVPHFWALFYGVVVSIMLVLDVRTVIGFTDAIGIYTFRLGKWKT
jgi:hypothetical protein